MPRSITPVSTSTASPTAPTTLPHSGDPDTRTAAKSFGSPFPNSTFTTARGLKQSVLYGRLQTAGAYFTESHGWELPDWFAPTPEQAHLDRTAGAVNTGLTGTPRSIVRPAGRGRD